MPLAVALFAVAARAQRLEGLGRGSSPEAAWCASADTRPCPGNRSPAIQRPAYSSPERATADCGSDPSARPGRASALHTTGRAKCRRRDRPACGRRGRRSPESTARRAPPGSWPRSCGLGGRTLSGTGARSWPQLEAVDRRFVQARAAAALQEDHQRLAVVVAQLELRHDRRRRVGARIDDVSPQIVELAFLAYFGQIRAQRPGREPFNAMAAEAARLEEQLASLASPAAFRRNSCPCGTARSWPA